MQQALPCNSELSSQGDQWLLESVGQRGRFCPSETATFPSHANNFQSSCHTELLQADGHMQTDFTCPESLPHSLTINRIKLNYYLAIWGILTNSTESDIASYRQSSRHDNFFTPQNRAEFTLYCLGKISDSLYIPAVSTQADNGHACVWLQQ